MRENKAKLDAAQNTLINSRTAAFAICNDYHLSKIDIDMIPFLQEERDLLKQSLALGRPSYTIDCIPNPNYCIALE